MTTRRGEQRVRVMRILCVHQGYELYGSDRCFADWVSAARAQFPKAHITVVLAKSGPIVDLLKANVDEFVFEPMWVLRRAHLKSILLKAPVTFPLALWRAWRRMRQASVVYLSTTVIWDYIVAARFAGRPTVLHIHEIPGGLFTKVLGAFVRFSRAAVVFNSNATRAAYPLAKGQEGTVVYNGITGPARAEPSDYDGSRRLRLVLAGRINRIKGQDVLVEALARLSPDQRARLDVRLIGGVFETDTAMRDTVVELIERHGLHDCVTLQDFQQDMSSIYEDADVVLVPSKRVETLGRVAIEGMAYAKPVIVARIGGLVETVEHGVSGWYVEPGDAEGLARQIAELLDNPALVRTFGLAGRDRYEKVFLMEAVDAQVRQYLAREFGGAADDPRLEPAARRSVLTDQAGAA